MRGVGGLPGITATTADTTAHAYSLRYLACTTVVISNMMMMMMI